MSKTRDLIKNYNNVSDCKTIIETTAKKPKKRYNPNRDPNFNPDAPEFENKIKIDDIEAEDEDNMSKNFSSEQS